MKLKCIIVDDEPLAQKGLAEYVHDVEFLELAGTYENVLKANEAISAQYIQLVFLDIQMPRISGLDFLKTLKHAPMIIITTAYPQHALESYEFDVLDYLVKPVSFPRFLKAVNKAKHQAMSEQKTQMHEIAEEHIFIKADNKLVKILYDDILFAEALQNYVCIQTTEKKYVTYLTFKAIEESLPKARFLKIHKSYIIQLSKVEAIEGNLLQLGKHSIPVSRNHKEEVMEKLVAGKYIKR